jgi:uncharacterized protein (DUF849 family)
MLLIAAINGKRTRNEHPAVPLTPSQQAALAVAAGAGAIHVHPRDAHGRESLAAYELAAALDAIRAACPPTPIGVSTGAWIVSHVEQRLAFIGAWEILPDFAGGAGGRTPAAQQRHRGRSRHLERPRGRVLAPKRAIGPLSSHPSRTGSGAWQSPRSVS